MDFLEFCCNAWSNQNLPISNLKIISGIYYLRINLERLQNWRIVCAEFLYQFIMPLKLNISTLFLLPLHRRPCNSYQGPRSIIHCLLNLHYLLREVFASKEKLHIGFFWNGTIVEDLSFSIGPLEVVLGTFFFQQSPDYTNRGSTKTTSRRRWSDFKNGNFVCNGIGSKFLYFSYQQ